MLKNIFILAIAIIMNVSACSAAVNNTVHKMTFAQKMEQQSNERKISAKIRSKNRAEKRIAKEKVAKQKSDERKVKVETTKKRLMNVFSKD